MVAHHIFVESELEAVNELEDEPVLTQEMMGSILAEASGENRWERFKEKRDIDFAYSLGEKARFRVNYLHFL